ncbi:holo-ACP synthase [Bacteroidota bacterium]
MIVGIGTDIIEIARIEKAIENYGERFLNRIFTVTERNYCEQFKDTKYLHYAARFAAKESFSKAIGTGITDGFKFSEIGVRNEPSGKPTIELFGGLKKQWGDCVVLVTLSHTENNALAFLIIEQC